MPEVVPLTLSTVCGGVLEDRFQEIYPRIIAALGKDGKGSLSITIDFERVADTATMVKTKFKLAPKFPAKSQASICQFNNDYKLTTDPPIEKPKVVNLFNGGEKTNAQ